MRLCKIGLILIIALGFVFIKATPTFSVTKQEVEELRDQIEAKNSKVKEIQDKIEKYKKNINLKRLERVSLSSQVSLIENRIEKVSLDIKSTNLQLEQTNLEIKSLEFSIEEKNKEIAEQKKTLANFIRMIHTQDQKNSIEILAGYENMSDFFENVQYLKTLHSTLADIAIMLQTTKLELEIQAQEHEIKKETLVVFAEELSAKQGELASQQNIKLNLIQETASSEQKFKTLVQNLRSQYEQIENEISSIERQMHDKLAETDAWADTGDLIMTWPVPSRYITSYFHDPDYPYRHIFEHSGIDLRAGQGTPIKAAGSGFVARARNCSSHLCYQYLLIVHPDKVSTLYGHMSSINVSEGDFVVKGDVVGLSGGTPGTVGAGPFVTGPHLHFETRVNGIPVNPLNYLQ